MGKANPKNLGKIWILRRQPDSVVKMNIRIDCLVVTQPATE